MRTQAEVEQLLSHLSQVKEGAELLRLPPDSRHNVAIGILRWVLGEVKGPKGLEDTMRLEEYVARLRGMRP